MPAVRQRMQAAAGTWQGAAPRGFLKAEEHGGRVAPARAMLERPEPRSVRVGSARMPLLGFGTYEVTTASVEAALAAGYTHFDCATFYANEAEVGKALAAPIAAGKRSDLFLTGKVCLLLVPVLLPCPACPLVEVLIPCLAFLCSTARHSLWRSRSGA